MEVHHHSHLASVATHTSGKKWTHYFWEFLMLFLAVFCGFLAENEREHFIEKKREKQYIASLLQDLESDAVYFANNIKVNSVNQLRMDSLFSFLHYLVPNKPIGKIYLLVKRINQRGDRFQYNSRTFEQLKSSGGLRLIRDRKILDSVSAYYESLKWADVQSNLRTDRQTDVVLANSTLFDAWVLRDINEDNYMTITPPPITEGRMILNNYAMKLNIYRATDGFLLNRVKNDYLPKAIKLIDLIKEEYHLK